MRAGCLLPVFLDVRNAAAKLSVDRSGNSYNRSGIHTMDLTLKGAGINA